MKDNILIKKSIDFGARIAKLYDESIGKFVGVDAHIDPPHSQCQHLNKK